MGSGLKPGGQQEEGRWSFRVNLESPMRGAHLGPRAAFRETPASPGGVRGVPPPPPPHPSRPPASRGRNVKDQLSAELRLPFRGAPGAGPSRAAELTGSVCPTGRTAPAKNSALPRAAGPEPGRRLWESRAATVRGTGGAPDAPPRAWPSPAPEAAEEAAGTVPSPQVPRRVAGQRAEERPRPSGMGAGGGASRALAWASLPLLGPPAGALCEDPLCCRESPQERPGSRRSLPGSLSEKNPSMEPSATTPFRVTGLPSGGGSLLRPLTPMKYSLNYS
ncbi:translation initiation factor IF-2-like isoform X2 [Herpailurus yagouaroundi]|uniref:translation initiation factor IF-2-like isoform X2 n=1 Tax=Herpailurus yagouaroundi TaxID=1608482 RepID=UPI001AD6E46B|nr:translation initiation factor IF-2-like isoform X2 [Puma yagouaroundi]